MSIQFSLESHLIFLFITVELATFYTSILHRDSLLQKTPTWLRHIPHKQSEQTVGKYPCRSQSIISTSIALKLSRLTEIVAALAELASDWTCFPSVRLDEDGSISGATKGETNSIACPLLDLHSGRSHSCPACSRYWY